MTTRIVVTDKKHPEDLPGEFYFSSPEKYGGVLPWVTR